MKTIIVLFLGLCIHSFSHCQNYISTEAPIYFVQCLFEIETQEEVNILQNELRLSPFFEMVRLDWHSQRALLFTHGIHQVSIEDVRSWFMQYSESVRCVNIGVKNIDVMEKFPFVNCEN